MTEILKHIKIIHDRATGIKGKLVLASYGEGLFPKIRHFKIGEYESMAKYAEQWSKESGRNVYASLAVFHSNLKSGKKGAEEKIVAVLGVVADFDDENAKDWKKRLPIEPDYVMETSKDRFQAVFLFSTPLSLAEAKTIGERLVVFSKCDSCTSDMSHVWRIPNTQNWPNEKKICEGRPKDPQIVKVVKQWDGSLTCPKKLSSLLPEITPQVEKLDSNIISEINIEELPKDLQHKITDGIPEGEGDRSSVFYHVICSLRQMGYTTNAIYSLLAAHPNGIAYKYASRGDLKKQVQKCCEKNRDRLDDFQDLSHLIKGQKVILDQTSIPFYSIDDLIKRPPPEWLIKDIFPKHSLCTIFGPSGSFKSFIAISLAMHVSLGLDLGQRKVKKGKVLFMLNEGQSAFAHRCKAWLKYNGFDEAENFFIAHQTINLSNDNLFKYQLNDIVANQECADLVVIDTLHKASLGMNENDACDMGLVLSRAQQIVDKLQCTVLLIDHTGKSDQKNARGSYVKRANVDMAASIKRNGKKSELTIEKQKDGEDGITLMFEQETCFSREYQEHIPVLHHVEIFKQTQSEFILDLLAENGKMKLEEIKKCFADKYPGSNGSERSVISRLKKEGSIVEKDGFLCLSVDS